MKVELPELDASFVQLLRARSNEDGSPRELTQKSLNKRVKF